MAYFSNPDHLKDFLEQVVEYAFEGLIVIDHEARIVIINQAYAACMGVLPSAVIGKLVEHIIPWTELPRTLKTGKPEFGFLFPLGDQQVIGARIPLIKDGTVYGAIGKIMFQDVQQLEGLMAKVNCLRSEVNYYKNELKRVSGCKHDLNSLIGCSDKIVQLKGMIKQVAKTPSTVLIRGESGTGKELVAHALHAESNRCQAPFVRLNCAALPESLFEAELFGYEEGAFTGARKGGKSGKFERAHGGTIFLDEIGDLPLGLQAKLLRVLQEKEIERVGGSKTIAIDVRVIAATNQNLEELVRERKFREDLYYRLNVVTMMLPPLRERREDIPLLVEFLLEKLSTQLGRFVRQIEPQALECLMQYRWPGNVRELENILERAINLLDQDQIALRHLPIFLQNIEQAIDASSYDLKNALAEAERQAMIKALHLCHGDLKKAQTILGISRSGLYQKLEKYQLQEIITPLKNPNF